jgi:transposase
MLSLSGGTPIYFCTQPTDMRKSFDGLARLVREFLQHDPLSGQLFVFLNKRRDRLKLLYWDTDGFALWYKRLEGGIFPGPFDSAGEPALKLSPAQLTLLLEGLEVKTIKQHKRYRHAEKTSAPT